MQDWNYMWSIPQHSRIVIKLDFSDVVLNNFKEAIWTRSLSLVRGSYYEKKPSIFTIFFLVGNSRIRRCIFSPVKWNWLFHTLARYWFIFGLTLIQTFIEISTLVKILYIDDINWRYDVFCVCVGGMQGKLQGSCSAARIKCWKPDNRRTF